MRGSADIILRWIGDRAVNTPDDRVATGLIEVCAAGWDEPALTKIGWLLVQATGKLSTE